MHVRVRTHKHTCACHHATQRCIGILFSGLPLKHKKTDNITDVRFVFFSERSEKQVGISQPRTLGIQ